jgi:hypothetical protein
MRSKWTVTGAVCLVGASVGALVQYLVIPIDEGDSSSAQVAAAAAPLTRMRWAAVLDLPILLIRPLRHWPRWTTRSPTCIGTGFGRAGGVGSSER